MIHRASGSGDYASRSATQRHADRCVAVHRLDDRGDDTRIRYRPGDDVTHADVTTGMVNGIAERGDHERG